jgi:hypothetical protein
MASIEWRAPEIGHSARDPVVAHGCDLGKNLAIQAMTNLAQRGSLGVREHHSAFQRFSVARYSFPGQQLLVHRRSAQRGRYGLGAHPRRRHRGVGAIAQKMYRNTSGTAMLAEEQLTVLSAVLVS